MEDPGKSVATVDGQNPGPVMDETLLDTPLPSQLSKSSPAPENRPPKTQNYDTSVKFAAYLPHKYTLLLIPYWRLTFQGLVQRSLEQKGTAIRQLQGLFCSHVDVPK